MAVLRNSGAPGEDGERLRAVTPARLVAGRTRGAPDDHFRARPDRGADLRAGSWRCAKLFLDQEAHQLLRTVRCRAEFGEHHQAHTALEAAQLLGVSLRTIDRPIALKELQVRRLGRQVLIPKTALESLMHRDHPTPVT